MRPVTYSLCLLVIAPAAAQGPAAAKKERLVTIKSILESIPEDVLPADGKWVAADLRDASQLLKQFVGAKIRLPFQATDAQYFEIKGEKRASLSGNIKLKPHEADVKYRGRVLAVRYEYEGGEAYRGGLFPYDQKDVLRKLARAKAQVTLECTIARVGIAEDFIRIELVNETGKTRIVTQNGLKR